jgi:hypothetical protein
LGLRPRGPGAFIQFVNATYEQRRKRKSLITLFERVVGALEDRAIVDWDTDGPWTASIVDWTASWVSELALDLLVSFKAEKYRRELEWRMVLRPSQDIPGSDRSSPDQAFNAMVVTGDNGKRYVELFVEGPPSGLVPSGRPPVPFDMVTIGPCAEAERLQETARRLLKGESSEDIPVHSSRPKWWARAL